MRHDWAANWERGRDEFGKSAAKLGRVLAVAAPTDDPSQQSTVVQQCAQSSTRRSIARPRRSRDAGATRHRAAAAAVTCKMRSSGCSWPL